MAKPNSLACPLPTYQTNRKVWRRKILSCARMATRARAGKWTNTGPFEVIVLLYLNEGKQHDKHDVDNRLKDVLDGLQGAFYEKAKGKKRAKGRIIKNDSSVCRVIVEKQQVPKKYKNRLEDAPGGRLLVRPYSPRRWRIQITKAE
ncbi:MAG: RusA family crossover junction endodeoxyribonuclease [Acidobacteria bacterium]|nr:RusA family crossover junction endodeoxyribonuclease [Acidobacteriota bacterium]MCA1650229.1 RusA family crossover junction endodeoxyribonuclease [Acidobacteriota bacterium]